MTAPLSHIRVLDLSRVLAGPWAAQFLADMGAEVIKIERPGDGDDTRGWGPPFAREPAGGDPGLSAYFLCTNRGKKSVTVDIAHPKGQELIRKIAAVSDVVIENFKAGGLAKYGLDYAALSAVNPRLVYCSITGFGQTGPYAPRAGYDFLVQGMGGLMSVTGEAEGEAGGGPVKAGVAISDVIAGFNALAAILSALVQRERTGRGEYIDVALLDCTVAALINQASTHLVAGAVPSRMGNAHPTIVPYQAFRTADGHLILAVGNDGQFQRFCAAAGLEALAEDRRYRTNTARLANRDTLIPEIAARLMKRTTAEWIALLEARNVPCGPINSIDQVFADPQVQARSMKRVLVHETAGPLPVVANPVRMASHDTTAPKPPPLLGEDTDGVLGGLLGLSVVEIAELRRERVV
jgi:crotonobetainyl-CoA:carnitine CoA-transferase CaiB-like acyl-CoA transferase